MIYHALWEPTSIMGCDKGFVAVAQLIWKNMQVVKLGSKNIPGQVPRIFLPLIGCYIDLIELFITQPLRYGCFQK